MDDVLKQFRSFCADNAANPDLLSFILGSSSLDVVLHSAMANKVEYEHLWSLSRKIQLLSHGQASVERGFSVNKEIISRGRNTGCTPALVQVHFPKSRFILPYTFTACRWIARR